MNRRSFLKFIASLPVIACSGLRAIAFQKSVQKSFVGAIRWDAWDAGAGSSEEAPVEASLGPEQWHRRAPWFAKPLGAHSITIDGGQQVTMDQEIRYASDAGLDYWAYCWYGSTDEYMQKAWKLHQSSLIKDRMNWCIILQFSRIGNPVDFRKLNSVYTSYFQQANYQKVINGRPLVFLFIDNLTSLKANWNSNWTSVRASFDQLRSACVNAGVADPYIVIMHGVPSTAKDIMTSVAADAISNYTGRATTGQPATYASTDTATQAFWASMAATGASIVPVCQTGWDVRPRKQNPPPWDSVNKANTDISTYVAPGTPTQIAGDVQAAITYVSKNPSVCASKSILIYSWNECDEGGSALIPTYSATGPDRSILNAVRKALKSR